MWTRARHAVTATALAALLLSGCSADVVTDGPGVTDELTAGMTAWRSAAANQARADQSAAVTDGLSAWRQATAERAQLQRLADVEQLRAEARASGDRIRIEAARSTRAVEVERLRAEAKVDGDRLRMPTVPILELDEKQLIVAAREVENTARVAEVERLRAEAKVAGDALRLRANTVLVWTESGPDENSGRTPSTRAADGECSAPRVVAWSAVAPISRPAAGTCPASIGLWVSGRSAE